MPPAYKDAQHALRKEIQKQWPYMPLCGPVALVFSLKGEARGDIDNIVGAFLDTAKDIIFIDDRVSIINNICATWAKASKADSEWKVWIQSKEEPINCAKAI